MQHTYSDLKQRLRLGDLIALEHTLRAAKRQGQLQDLATWLASCPFPAEALTSLGEPLDTYRVAWPGLRFVVDVVASLLETLDALYARHGVAHGRLDIRNIVVAKDVPCVLSLGPDRTVPQDTYRVVWFGRLREKTQRLWTGERLRQHDLADVGRMFYALIAGSYPPKRGRWRKLQVGVPALNAIFQRAIHRHPNAYASPQDFREDLFSFDLKHAENLLEQRFNLESFH